MLGLFQAELPLRGEDVWRVILIAALSGRLKPLSAQMANDPAQFAVDFLLLLGVIQVLTLATRPFAALVTTLPRVVRRWRRNWANPYEAAVGPDGSRNPIEAVLAVLIEVGVIVVALTSNIPHRQMVGLVGIGMILTIMMLVDETRPQFDTEVIELTETAPDLTIARLLGVMEPPERFEVAGSLNSAIAELLRWEWKPVHVGSSQGATVTLLTRQAKVPVFVQRRRALSRKHLQVGKRDAGVPSWLRVLLRAENQ